MPPSSRPVAASTSVVATSRAGGTRSMVSIHPCDRRRSIVEKGGLPAEMLGVDRPSRFGQFAEQ